MINLVTIDDHEDENNLIHVAVDECIFKLLGDEDFEYVGIKKEKIDQVQLRYGASAFFVQVPAGVSEPPGQAAADQHHGADPHFFHGGEIPIPFCGPPVLVGNVPRDLIEKSCCDFHFHVTGYIRIRRSSFRPA